MRRVGVRPINGHRDALAHKARSLVFHCLRDWRAVLGDGDGLPERQFEVREPCGSVQGAGLAKLGHGGHPQPLLVGAQDQPPECPT